MIDRQTLKEKSSLWGVSLSEDQLDLFDTYATLLVEWNQKINLTSIVDPAEIVTKHFEDCLSFLNFVFISQGATVIDVGTGGGFPGMVLKIARPDIQLTLLDSLNKRINFLNLVSHDLDLEVNAVHFRAEEAAINRQFREQFDIACARAVSNLRSLAEYCIPFVKVGGQFVSMKGPAITEELTSARPGIGTLGGKVASVYEYVLSDGSGRSLVCIDKIRETPPQFPRSSAKIQKKPL